MKRYVFILLAISSRLMAQQILPDSVFLSLVINNHPLAKQALLEEQKGNFYFLKSKGNFDPKMYADYNTKQFDGKNYYQFASSQVKIPTWIGADVKMGYDWNNGYYINPENNLPTNGLISLGVELNVLQGLLYDQRRLEWQQGKNYKQIGLLQSQQMLNELVYNASEAYWLWYEAYKKMQINKEGVLLAKESMEMTKASYLLGDKRALDTLEAKVQVDYRFLELKNAELNWQQASLLVASYLWMENEEPFVLKEEVIPQDFTIEMANWQSNDEMQAKAADWSLLHPKTKLYEYKFNNTLLSHKLSKEGVKPSLKVGYNFINKPLESTPFDQFNINNRKWNVNFTMPLLWRKGRGELKLAKAISELAEFDYKNQNYQQEIKIKSVWAKVQNYIEQLEINTLNLQQNRDLVAAEKRLFTIGESSLFLVNYRELNLLKLLEKQANLQQKLKVALAQWQLETAVSVVE